MLDTSQQLHAALKLTIKHFIVVLDALGDSEMRWLSSTASWDRAVADASTAYGYTPVANVRLCPTSREVSQAEVVATWLTWLGKVFGPSAVPRLVNWAHDEPLWRMAQREKCSERTIVNRIDRSVAAIMEEFGGGQCDIEIIEEQPDKPIRHFASETRAGHAGIRDSFGKIWIDGVGFMKDGRKWDDGKWKAARFLSGAFAG